MKKLFIALMLALTLLTAPALADESSNYDFLNIGISGISYAETVYVERGDSVPVEVYFTGTGETTDVNLKVWIGGYEYDNVFTASSMFDVEDGVTYRKTLNLEIPDDMIAEQDYTVYIEMYDDEDYVREEATIRVSNVRHDVRVQDILVDNSVDAGEYTSVTVRLENMGDNKEEDIKVTVSNEALGLELSTYLDELTNTEIDNEDEESSGDVTFTFAVPAEADGLYTLTVDVLYDNGHNEVSSETSLSVEGAVVAEDGTVVVSADDGNTVDSDDTSFVTALKLGFGILAVLIVILALILIVRK